MCQSCRHECNLDQPESAIGQQTCLWLTAAACRSSADAERSGRPLCIDFSALSTAQRRQGCAHPFFCHFAATSISAIISLSLLLLASTWSLSCHRLPRGRPSVISSPRQTWYNPWGFQVTQTNRRGNPAEPACRHPRIGRQAGANGTPLRRPYALAFTSDEMRVTRSHKSR
jgi:hypothetical protein